MQKAQADISHTIATTNGHVENEAGDVGRMVIHEDGSVCPGTADSHPHAADDNASTRAMASPPMTASSAKDVDGASLDLSSAIPIIRISTESGRDREETSAEDIIPPYKEAHQNGVSDTLEKPVQAAAGETEQGNGESNALSAHEPFSFSNKRLCERWLDNLFMVLYEVSMSWFITVVSLIFCQDLRVWTIFRAEVAHFKTQHVAYRKTGLEWEILGDLGLRLHHKEEAKEAYQRCLDSPRYSQKPWVKLMEMYADEGDIQRSIQTAIRVAAYQYAEYTEMTVCS